MSLEGIDKRLPLEEGRADARHFPGLAAGAAKSREEAAPRPSGQRLLLVGHSGVEHVGSHLRNGANDLGLSVRFCDVSEASRGLAWRTRWNWWVRGHRPCRLGDFSREVVEAAQAFRPLWILSTGIAPLEARALEVLGRMGIKRFNYLTDDPWNPAHRAPWFFKALALYDQVFSPRRANIPGLERMGCPQVSYAPFAYAPEIHFPEPPATAKERARYACDVLFVGGADRDRLPWIRALIRAGFQVALYGGYWDRFHRTRAYARGSIDPSGLRRVVSSAKVTLCLVRRANRDGHSMRSFEIPAMKGCMLVEYTEEHRELFGSDGESVVYFRTADEMIEKLRWLLSHEGEQQRLAGAVFHKITQGHHTYRDRLKTMLSL